MCPNWIVKKCTEAQRNVHVTSQESFHGSNATEYITTRACDSSVGIATRYGLEGPRDRFPVRARYSETFQTGPGTHPASYTMDFGSFPGLKWPWFDVDHTYPSVAEVKGRVELYLYSLSGLSWRVIVWTIHSTLHFPVPRMWYHLKPVCSKREDNVAYRRHVEARTHLSVTEWCIKITKKYCRLGCGCGFFLGRNSPSLWS